MLGAGGAGKGCHATHPACHVQGEGEAVEDDEHGGEGVLAVAEVVLEAVAVLLEDVNRPSPVSGATGPARRGDIRDGVGHDLVVRLSNVPIDEYAFHAVYNRLGTLIEAAVYASCGKTEHCSRVVGVERSCRACSPRPCDPRDWVGTASSHMRI